MPKSLRQKLLEKGWDEAEVDRSLSILNSDGPETKNSNQGVFLSRPIIYWSALFLAILGNLVVGVVFIPFLMVLKTLQLYVIMGSMGLIFGAMFHILLKDIEHADSKHRVVAGVFIPAIALITVYVMATLANTFNVLLKNPLRHSPFGIGAVYVIAFTIPYAYDKLKDFLEESVQHKQLPSS